MEGGQISMECTAASFSFDRREFLTYSPELAAPADVEPLIRKAIETSELKYLERD